ncbi:hypothetical protein [Dactylosporangium sp. CA-233914]|uniref:hypothetical protein n=1 Tax=Dactylosporangium sp. CA-233914 TaxID=3239934 RepID=UPI003D8A339D
MSVTDVTLTLKTTGNAGVCYPEGVPVDMSWVLHVNTQAPTQVRLEVQSSDGIVLGGASIGYTAFDGVADGLAHHTVHWDKDHAQRTVEYWIQVLAPSRVQSSHVKFSISCRTPTRGA